MSDKRYYTPELSEFHVGFEYEYLPRSENEWVKKTVNSCVNLVDIEDVLAERLDGEIRVKHLDHDDIVAEGWKHEGEQLGGDVLYTIGRYSLFDYGEQKVCIDEGDFDFGEPEIKFDGTIRNRSELRLIMKMLGIKQQ